MNKGKGGPDANTKAFGVKFPSVDKVKLPASLRELPHSDDTGNTHLMVWDYLPFPGATLVATHG